MRQLGILQILLSGLCFGFLGIFGKWAFAAGLQPGEFLSLRFLLASVFLFLWLTIRGESPLSLPRSARVRALGLGVAGYAVFSSCYFLALQGLSASLTVLLLYTYPVWVALGGHFFLRERLQPAQWWALPLMFTGLLFLLWGELQAHSPLALAYGLLSAVFYSAYILSSRRLLVGVPPASAAFYVVLGAGLVLGLLHLRELPSTLPVWGVLVGTALLGTVCAISLFLAGLQKLKSAEASLLSLAEPITGVALAALVFGERLTFWQCLGGVGIVTGMILVARGHDGKRT